MTMTRLGLVFVALITIGCGTSAPPPAPTVPTESKGLSSVQEIVAQEIGLEPEDVSPDKTFDELGADGLDFISIVTEVEVRLGVAITVEVLEKATGVSDPKDMPATLTVHQFAEVVESLKTPADPPTTESEPEMP
ncbi:acyl carrier protein [Blastopirellula marina]|nr:acyl carrier protein [Blastopirellula marina]